VLASTVRQVHIMWAGDMVEGEESGVEEVIEVDTVEEACALKDSKGTD
jgi:hypothetical protein